MKGVRSIFLIFALFLGSTALVRADVDKDALSVKRKVIRAMEALLKTSSSQDEGKLLNSLLETLYAASLIEFRVAHADANKAGKKPDMQAYNSTLRKIVHAQERLERGHPKSNGMARSIYLKAKALAELNEKHKAIFEYKRLVDRYSDSDDGALGNLSLCDLLIETKDYNSAIHYLNVLAKQPKPRFYPLAMGKLGWVYYYKNDIKNALKHISKELTFYEENSEDSKNRNSEWEKALSNSVLFYFSGWEVRKSEYSIEESIRYFKLLKPKHYLGKMLAQFVVLFRVKAHDKEVEQIKDLAVAEEITVADKADILLLCFENQINKRRYSPLKKTVAEIVAFYKDTASEDAEERKEQKIRKALFNSASNFQSIYAQNKDNSEGPQIIEVLTLLYDRMLDSFSIDTQFAQAVHFNLAELETEQKHLEKAVTHFRWVVENGKSNTPETKKVFDQAWRQSIALRFEVLKSQGVVPQSLKAVVAGSASEKSLPDTAVEWIEWVDQCPKDILAKDSNEVFVFEAARILYSNGHIEKAIERMLEFVSAYPQSKYAQAIAALTIDTYVQSQWWERAFRLTAKWTEKGYWKETDFAGRLVKIGGDSFYKIIEGKYKDEKYSSVIEDCEELQKTFSKNEHQKDCDDLVANSYLALGEKEKAVEKFEKLKKEGLLRSELIPVFGLTKLSVFETRFNYTAAFNEIDEALKKHGTSPAVANQIEALEQKYFFYGLASTDANALKKTKTYFCEKQKQPGCEKLQAYQAFGAAEAQTLGQILKKSDPGKNDPESAFLWTTIGFKNAKQFSFEDRALLSTRLVELWDKVSFQTAQFAMPVLNTSVPDVLKHSRAIVRVSARLSLNKQIIQKRAELIDKVESIGLSLLKIPSKTIQYTVYKSLSGLYEDFSKELSALAEEQIIAEIRAPFDQKKEQYLLQANQVQSIYALDEKPSKKHNPNAKLFEVLNQEVSEVSKSAQQYWKVLCETLESQNNYAYLFAVGQDSENNVLSQKYKALLKGAYYLKNGMKVEAAEEWSPISSSFSDNFETFAKETIDKVPRAPASVSGKQGG